MLNKIDMYFFSPTGGTRRVAEAFCAGLAGEIVAHDMCRRDVELAQPTGEAAVIAVPVYGGRIPRAAAQQLARLAGNGLPAVTIAVYGNRAYEDALLETNDIAAAQGFSVLASLACVAQHSMDPEAAAGRPDADDAAQLREFAGKVLGKLAEGGAAPDVPGNRPYKASKGMPVTPVSLEGCVRCGACARVCPTGAITVTEQGVDTAVGVCEMCMACLRVCRKGVRVLPPPMLQNIERIKPMLRAGHKENELFL